MDPDLRCEAHHLSRGRGQKWNKQRLPLLHRLTSNRHRNASRLTMAAGTYRERRRTRGRLVTVDYCMYMPTVL